jgi:hypothetical protein
VSRSTYKWYPTSGTHEDKKYSRNGFYLTKPTSGSMLENSSMWYHIPTHGINHTRRWFHKWSSTLSDHLVKQVPSHTRAQVYQMDDPCYDIGGGAPPIGIKVKRSYMRYLKGYKWCIPTYVVVSIKNSRFKCQPSTPMQPFVSRDAHLWK